MQPLIATMLASMSSFSSSSLSSSLFRLSLPPADLSSQMCLTGPDGDGDGDGDGDERRRSSRSSRSSSSSSRNRRRKEKVPWCAVGGISFLWAMASALSSPKSLWWWSSSLLLPPVAVAAAAADGAGGAVTSECPSGNGGDESLSPSCGAAQEIAAGDEDAADATCSLYLAPSTIPGAGLGLFTAVDLPPGSALPLLLSAETDLHADSDAEEPATIPLEDPYIPILDHYKTLPYRGQHDFLSWLGYVWPRHVDAFHHKYHAGSYPEIPRSRYRVDHGLSAAVGMDFWALVDGDTGTHANGDKHGDGRAGETRHSATRRTAAATTTTTKRKNKKVSAFAPGAPSLINSHPYHANVRKNDDYDRQTRPRRGGTTDGAMNVSSSNNVVSLSTVRPVPSGSELFLYYGDEWHRRHVEKYGASTVQPFATLEQYRANVLPRVVLPTENDKRRRWMQSASAEDRKKLRRVVASADDVEHEEITSHGDNEVSVDRVDRVGNNVDMTSEDENDNEGSSDDDEEEHESDVDENDEEEEEEEEEDMGRVVQGVLVKYEDVAEYYSDEEKMNDEKDDDEIEDGYDSEDDDDDDDEKYYEEEEEEQDDDKYIPPSRSITYLQQHGACMSNLRPGLSTIPNAGRGAFATWHVRKGNVISVSTLAVLKSEDLVIYGTRDNDDDDDDDATSSSGRYRDFLDTNRIVGHEPLLNYCYGAGPKSDILFLPLGPGVNYINHAVGTDDKLVPNVAIRWPTTTTSPSSTMSLVQSLGVQDASEWFDMHPLDLIDKSGKILWEYVALRDILPGEEVLLDYGPEWEGAYHAHVSSTQEGRTGSGTNEDVGHFRHEIMVPRDTYPARWYQRALYEYTPLDPSVPVGTLVPLTWKHDGSRVDDRSYRMRLPDGFSARMKSFADASGITDKYEELLRRSYLEDDGWDVFEGKEEAVTMVATETNGRQQEQRTQQWFVHRYMSTAWKFNMHYIAAWNDIARADLFRALGNAGFDTVLNGTGTTFRLDNMTCIHVSFMGVSECDNSFTHADVYATDRKGYNIVWPIVVVDGSEPELDIISDNANVVVPAHYNYDVAFVLGDWGYHKTSPIDYGENTGDIRIVVGMYCAQIDDETVDMMAYIYDGEDPAPFADQFKVGRTDVHWSRDGRSLPK